MDDRQRVGPRKWGASLGSIRDQAPLIHHITNVVTIYECAQITRAMGALPVMAFMRDELADVVAQASALVLNIGTLTLDVLESMVVAGQAANERHIPVVLDIVGCGASGARTAAAKRLFSEVSMTLIKGNPAEIGAASGAETRIKGVESISVCGDISAMARELAESTTSVVVVTGVTDIVTDGKGIRRCRVGHPLMRQVVGTGCMAGSVLATFAAVDSDVFQAAVDAMRFYGSAAEMAAEKTDTPMAFRNALIDCVYRLSKMGDKAEDTSLKGESSNFNG